MSRRTTNLVFAFVAFVLVGCVTGPRSAEHRITAVSITHAGGCEECPRYTATLFNDGRVEYSGGEGAPFAGNWTASVAQEDFDLLARLIERERYFSFDDTYGELGTHAGPVTTSVVANGRRKTVVNHGSLRPAGPLELQWIEAAIEIVIRRATDWTQASAAPAPR